MRRILIGIGLAMIVLLCVMLVRTLMVGAPAARIARAAPVEVDANKVAQHLAEAIRFKTISFDNKVNVDEKNAQLRAMRTWLEQTYPAFHMAARREVIDESLLFIWAGKDPKLKPVLLMAHMDVVPVAPGTEKDWTHEAFSGDIADGFVWGRGSLDDKGSLIGLLEAAEKLASSGFKPNRTIMFAFGQDEEIGGLEGNKVIAATLKERGVRFEWLLDEGGFIRTKAFEGVDDPVALVSVSEKGYLSVQLVSHAPGGHSSMPSTDLANAKLSRAILNILDHPFSSSLNEVHYKQFEILAPMLPFGRKFIFSNLWLTSPLVKQIMESEPRQAASLHTTISPTMLNAGIKDNVLPQSATATVNLRLDHNEPIDKVIQHLEKAINDPKVDVIKIASNATEAPPISDMNSESYQFLTKVIAESVDASVVAPMILPASTDSKHYVPLADNTYRFMPVLFGSDDLTRIHGTNERVALSELVNMVGFYFRLMRDMK